MNTNLSTIESQEAEYQRLYSADFNEHIHLANRMAVTIQLTKLRSTTTWIFQGKKTHIHEKIRQAPTFMYLLQQDEGKLLILCPMCQNHCSRRFRLINTWVSLIGGGVEEGKNSRCGFDDHDQGHDSKSQEKWEKSGIKLLINARWSHSYSQQITEGPAGVNTSIQEAVAWASRGNVGYHVF